MIKSITNISWLESMTLIVPGNLRYDAEIETLYSDINKISDPDEPILLDGSYLNWVEPYSLISLISGCRLLYQSTKQKIVLRRLRDDVHRYLERMDVFDICNTFLSVQQQANNVEKYSRSENSQKLLEVMAIPSSQRTNPIEVKKVLRRSKAILSTWLEDGDLIRSIQTLVSEIAHNITHSNDEGFIAIQRYKQPYSDDNEWASEIHIAIGDLGVGIQKSLLQQNPMLAKKFKSGSDYILHALEQGTSGVTGMRGIGLPRVQSLVAKWDGQLLIRSGTSKIVIDREDVNISDNLTKIPGVQISIIVRRHTQI